MSSSLVSGAFHDLPLEVVIEFIFPFLMDGELVHLRILSTHLQQVLLRNIKTLTLNHNRVANYVLKMSDHESLFRLLEGN